MHTRSKSGLLLAVGCAALAGAGACNNSMEAPYDGMNAPSDGVAVPGEAPMSVEIAVTVPETPSLILFRDGTNADWQAPVASAPGRYLMNVHGLYTVVAVCMESALEVELAEASRTLDDPHEFEMPCLVRYVPPSKLVPVTGTMVQRGVVTLGPSRGSGDASNWQFDLLVPEGVADLVATSMFAPDGDHIAIRRDLPLTEGIVVPPIDVAAEGVPLTQLPLTVTNLRSVDYVSAGFTLYTPSTTMTVTNGPVGATVGVVPDSVLRPGDKQRVLVDIFSYIDDGIFRGMSRALVPGVSTVFTAPDVIDASVDPVDPDRGFTWKTLPGHDTIDLWVGGSVGDTFVERHKQLTSSYETATAATTISWDSDIPGYKPEWRSVFAMEYSYELEVWRFVRDASSSRITDASSSSIRRMVNVGASNRPATVPCRVPPAIRTDDVLHRIGGAAVRQDADCASHATLANTWFAPQRLR